MAKGASESQINKIELRLQHTLPDDYRKFLESSNGGIPSRRRFRIPDCNAEALVDVLLGVDGPNDLVAWIEELSDDLPTSFIPIGFDPGGNAILLDASTGEVFYWDSARHFETSNDEQNTFAIARSFTEFLEKLEE
jgi:cell wall assembly regulator SMI1